MIFASSEEEAKLNLNSINVQEMGNPFIGRSELDFKEKKINTFKEFIYKTKNKEIKIPQEDYAKSQNEWDIDLTQIRNFLDSISLCGADLVQILPIINDNIYVTYGICEQCDDDLCDREVIVEILPDRNWNLYYADRNTTWLSHTINPTTGTPASICSIREGCTSNYCYDYYWISADGYDSSYCAISRSDCSWQFKPTEISFDKYGSLYILGNRWSLCFPASEFKTCIWKFNPGEKIWLDPYNSNSLTPGGIRGLGYELYISGDGSIYCYIKDYSLFTNSILEIPFATNINYIYKVSTSIYDFYSELAVDCKNKIYLSKQGWDLKGYDYPNFENPTTIPLISPSVYDVKLNNYGEIFILHQNLIHIVMSYELPEGWYSCNLCKYPGESAFNLRAISPNCSIGEGEIILRLDKDPQSTEDQVIILNSGSKVANILFGQKPKIFAYWKDTNGNEKPIEVKWELTSSNVSLRPTSVSNSSLFKTTPVLLFTNNENPYINNYLEFQTVHTGNIKLKTTFEDNNIKSELEIEININIPSSLGNIHNNYDGEIIRYAHKYGIPPQYLKGHVEKEARTMAGNYRADSFRYELIGWDYGTAIPRGIHEWSQSEWRTHGTDYACFNYPDGTNLSQQVIQKIKEFSIITNMDLDSEGRVNYECSLYRDYVGYAYLVDVYNANNGWGDGSYPNTFYNRRGPCNRREGWDKYAFGRGNWVAYDFGFYYCNFCNWPETNCNFSQQRFINFLYNNPFYFAQIPIGSSYGLMQIMYITATERGRWKRNEPACSREPSLLFDVDENLDIGAKIDSEEMGHRQIESSSNFNEYEEKLRTGFGAYHMPLCPDLNYGSDVLGKSRNFMPRN